MIYDGESIDAKGIEMALELEYIPISEKPLLVRKIIAYFSGVRSAQSKNMSARR